MDFSIPAELAMLQQTVRDFVRRHLRPLEGEIDEQDFIAPDVAADLRGKVIQLGLYAYNMPEELGGPGLSVLGQVLISEELGHTSMPLGEVFGRQPDSLRFCSPAQREWLARPALEGRKTLAYALTEPSAGSDLGSIETRARRVDGGWVVNGSKHFISNADTADHVFVLAVTDPAASLKGRFTTFVVDRDNPGFKKMRRFRKMGWRGYHLSAFALDDCFVPDSHVLGSIGGGFGAIMATVNYARLHVGGRCVGMADELLQQGRSHARQRVTFGSKLADHQAIQMRIADIDTELEAARLLVYKGASLADSGGDFRIAASRAKLYASEMAGRAADSVLQIFGGAGYMCDFPIERIYRDVRAFRIGEGTSEMQRIQIARHVLG